MNHTGFKELANNVKALRQRLETEMPIILLRNAVTTTSIVRNEAINEGINVDAVEGQKAQYSTNKYPTAYLIGKERNQGGRDYIKKNKLGNWFEFRVAQGLTSTVVNANYTGRFWNSLLPGVVSRLAKGYSLNVAVSDALVAQYADKLVDEYGDFYEPTRAQKQDAEERIGEELEAICKQYL